MLLREPVRFAESSVAARIALVVWAFVYFAYPLAAVRPHVRHGDRRRAGGASRRPRPRPAARRRARARAPLSFLLFGLGFLLILLRRDRRALHDLIASTAVVYAWDASAARLRFLLKQ